MKPILNIQKFLAAVMFLLLALPELPSLASTPGRDSIDAQRDTLTATYIVASLKQPSGKSSSPISEMALTKLERRFIDSPKKLSALVPNLMIPDYGAAMTSTVYMRGFGSRMENPVMALYVDDVPVLNKNSYDFQMADIRSVNLLRGPQGTLYGRNSMCGVLDLTTLSPADFQGGEAKLEYGSRNTFSATASVYHGKVGVVAGIHHTDGFYRNDYDGSLIDKGNGGFLRIRYSDVLKNGYAIDNSLSINALSQGAFPYAQVVSDGGTGQIKESWILPVSFNDDSSYKRISIMDGLRLSGEGEKLSVSSVTSIQILLDRMDMDQDFTEKSMFTLGQIQREYALTQEVIFKPVSHPKWWDCQSGVFGFLRWNDMSAPVRFKRDGIQELILDNANSYIPVYVGQLDIEEDSFKISSDFGIFTGNAAVYHESYFTFGRLHLTAGLRLDWEGGVMDYDSNALIHYNLLPYVSEFQALETVYEGTERISWIQLVPKLSVSYDLGKNFSVFATVSKGFKSGGFNTQIFSDILQTRMTSGLMEAFGVHVEGMEDGAEAEGTKYKPEKSTNWEAGFKGTHSWSSTHRISGSANVFYISARDQQITVFPEGNSTGRMMANVGSSQSAGAEAEIAWTLRNFSLSASYGYTKAEFDEYSDGNDDYGGNRIPYSPEQTGMLRCEYVFPFASGVLRSLAVGADECLVGRIWWNEANTLWQNSYSLTGADIRLDFGRIEVSARGDNLFGEKFNTFAFMSVGNQFVQRGKPRRITAALRFRF